MVRLAPWLNFFSVNLFDAQDFLRDDRHTEEEVDVLIVKVLEELGCSFEKVRLKHELPLYR